MTTEERIEIMKAYVNGKQIQFRAINSSSIWHDIDEPQWDWSDSEYRIKPEPKRRPYKDAEEFLKALKEHGPMIKDLDPKIDVYLSVIGVYPDRKHITTNIWNIEFESLLNGYAWQDGTPCGVVEE